VASEHSYSITLSNNRTEKAATAYVMESDSCFWLPSSRERKQILEMLGLPRSFSRAFDLVHVEDSVRCESGLTVSEIERVTLVELKTTRKHLPELPKGFFFGATQNEFDLAASLGDRYRFCFVCLHPESQGFCQLTLSELEPLMRTRRTQFQINL
jgi:hypothetical protein